MDTHQKILDKRVQGKRLSSEEGVALYSCDLLALGKVARELTNRTLPGAVTFVVDRNVSCTNVCTVGCGFCAFHCAADAQEAYVLSEGEVLARVAELVKLGGTQVLIQGGANPGLTPDYYLGLVRAIHEKFPQVHIHSFSAVEMDMLSRKSGIALPELFRMFREAGLTSLPGGGAEILVERVRKLISPHKISSDRWIEVMRTAHEAGLKTTATMVFGHAETLEERILHLIRLRDLQDETNGFRAFIPWSLVPNRTPGMKDLKPAGGDDYLKTVAIARLMLDNFDHIQSGWLTEGMKLGQVALAFGCDDLGGTLIEDKVLEPTGIGIRTRQEDLIRLIQDAGYVPVQRDTNYKVVKIYNRNNVLRGHSVI